MSYLRDKTIWFLLGVAGILITLAEKMNDSEEQLLPWESEDWK